MKIFLSIKSIPEFSSLSKEEITSTWKRSCSLAIVNWRVFIPAIFLCGGFPILGHLTGQLIEYPLLGIAIGSAIGGLVWSQLLIAYIRKNIIHKNGKIKI